MYQVKADEFLVDVFYNLLHNSVRLDHSDAVRIEIHLEKENEGFLIFRIKDCGPGIEDSKKELLLSTGGDRSKRVRGIGLTLVKRIIDRYGGYIWVEDSVKGDHTKGVCFAFSLPLAE